MIRHLAVIAALAVATGACDQRDRPTTQAEPKLTAGRTVPPDSIDVAKAPVGREPIAYTSLKPADCRLLERNAEEAGYSRHRCDGLTGYALETTESDLRQDLVVISPDGKRSELGLSSKVAKGAFNALGPAAEWRGSGGKPTALIVRLGVANGADPEQPDSSNLVVVKLAEPACVVAVVPPGPGQNDSARDIADGPERDCRD